MTRYESNHVYWVQFHAMPTGHTTCNHFFSSLAAIYDVFSDDEIGCKLQNLYTYHVSDGNVYNNKHCRIKRVAIVSKRNRKRSPRVSPVGR